jgi:cytochrome c553
MKPALLSLLALAVALTVAASVLLDPVPTTIEDVFLPGSQPGESGQLEHPGKCDNCHGGYDLAVEPAFNWRGSMMSQAARDPLFYACLAIANQDAPESGDLCIRCHSPAGWLEGRSLPTDGSALNNNDREGVQCDFCHKLVRPTELGVNPYPGDADYTAGTYDQDQAYLSTLGIVPTHSANGMYIADASNAKRGPFTDAEARHKMLYSPFHQEAALCGTCHDVSNPVYMADGNGNYVPNDFGARSPSFDPYTMFPIERTYSEWLNSDYNTEQGVFAPQFGGNKQYVSTCQDCHMRDVTGVAANKRGAVHRTDLPLHDMTGGNTFIPGLIDQLFPGETDLPALAEGVNRARRMLQMAATLDLTVTPGVDGLVADVRVTNETGHKLPSGYPEGRRIWLNVQAFDASDNLVYESGHYDLATGVLSHDDEAKIYEIKPGISAALAPVVGLSEGPSFHFVLNNEIFSDNRIPPRGFTNANFEAIQSPPINYTYADGQYWDDTQYVLPAATDHVEVNLYYQTTSKEYVEFLRDENRTNDWGQIFYDLWAANGKSAPELMARAVWPDNGPQQSVMHVESITVTREGRGKTLNGVASVAVVDESGNVVPGAVVSGVFNAPTSDTKTGTTDGQGTAEIKSDKTKSAPAQWCFEVADITLEGALYDAAQNVVSSGCEPLAKTRSGT